MYEYTVTENEPKEVDKNNAEKLVTYDTDASYKLRVYVERDVDGNHFVKGYTVVTSENDNEGTGDQHKLAAKNFKFINKMNKIAERFINTSLFSYNGFLTRLRN